MSVRKKWGKGYKIAIPVLAILTAGMMMKLPVLAAEITTDMLWDMEAWETEEEEVPMPEMADSGSCGTSMTWSYDSGTKTLTISGTENMANYTSGNPAPWYNVRENIESVVVGDGVTGIGNQAFYGCSNLSSIKLPDGITSIGDTAFNGCSSLSSIKLPAGVTSIENMTFNGCSSLSSIELPAGITSIGNYAFQGCSSLSSIKLPDGVTSIGSSTFSGCSSLNSIELPAGVTSIGNYAFYGCSSLNSIELPTKVTNIGKYAFQGCSSLSSIELPAGVTTIGNSAFYGCSSLSSIELPAGVTSIGDNAFWACWNMKTAVTSCSWKSNPLYQFDSKVSRGYNHTGPISVQADNNLGTISIHCEDCSTNLDKITLVIPTDRTYTGSPIEATVSSNNVLYTAKVTYTGTNLVDGKPVNAGIYTAIMSVNTQMGVQSVSLEYEIEKAPSLCTSAPTAKNLTYTGQAQELVNAGTAGNGTLQYSLKENGTYTTAIPAGTNAGTYTVYYIVAGDSNHKDTVINSVDVTIEKAEYTPEEINKNYLYLKENAEDFDLTASLPADCGTVSWSEPQTEGIVTYSVMPAIKNGRLSYTLNAGETDAQGTVKVTVTSDNYEDFDIIVNVRLYNRTPIRVKEGTEVTLKNNTLILGEALSVLEFHPATFEDENGNEVAGTLAWKEPQTVPTLGTQSATWIFIPDNPEYATLEGNVAIIVNQSADAPNKPASAMKVPFAIRKVSEVALPENWAWKTEDADKALKPEEPLTVTAVYIGADKEKYKTTSVEVTITRAGKEWIFTDVAIIPGQWKYEAVKYVYNNDIMNGISGTTEFRPDIGLNRAMFATVLYRMAGSPQVQYEDVFTDVAPGKYYTEAVLWAKQKGIVSGFSDGSYGVETNITREQIAKMLCEYATKQGYDVSGKTSLDTFTDQDSVSGWATGYMQWAVNAGMISGKPNGDDTFRLDPKGNATRAECAKMLQYFMTKYQ